MTQNNQRVKFAFAAGAVEKLAERQVDINQFVNVAAQSNNPDLKKVASLIVELDQAVKQEQMQKQAAYQRQVQQQQLQAQRQKQAAAPGGGGKGKMIAGGLGALGLAGGAGYAGHQYLTGDSGTTGNAILDDINRSPIPMDFDTLSRLQHAQQGGGIGAAVPLAPALETGGDVMGAGQQIMGQGQEALGAAAQAMQPNMPGYIDSGRQLAGQAGDAIRERLGGIGGGGGGGGEAPPPQQPQ